MIHPQQITAHDSKSHPHPRSKLCPSCQLDPEDLWHFLQCDHQDQWHLFEKLWTQLTAISVKHATQPSILTAFWLSMLAIQNNTPYPNVIHELPPEISLIVSHQEWLGWEQLYQGCLTKFWTLAIDTLHPDLAISGCQLMTQIIQMVWHYFLAMWALCNQHLHQDAGHLSIPDYQQAVHTLYNCGIQLPPAAHKALFQQWLKQILEQPPTVLWTWFEHGDWYMNWQLKVATICAWGLPQTFAHFLVLNPSQRMISNLHKRLYYTALVWVFFVQHSLRVITLKKQVF